MQKKNIKQIQIQDNDVVAVVQTINNVDLRFTSESSNSETGAQSERGTAKQKVKRKDQNHYVDPQTGRTHVYKRTGKRLTNESTFFRTKRQLNFLILNSFSGERNELFVTFTYSAEMDDPANLSTDFNNFIRRLRRAFKDFGFDYIVVKEPHVSGNWHMHALIKYACSGLNSTVYPEIDEWQATLTRIWALGTVKVEPIDKVNELASYLTAHLTDLIVDENGEEVDFRSSQKLSGKKVAKNARLALYPQHLKIYSYSAGFSKPQKRYMTFAEFKRRYENDYDINYDNSFILSNSDFALKQRQMQFTKKRG